MCFETFFSLFLIERFLSVDLEGRSDDKIRIMEVVHELQSKRADKQVIVFLRVCLRAFSYKGFKSFLDVCSFVTASIGAKFYKLRSLTLYWWRYFLY